MKFIKIAILSGALISGSSATAQNFLGGSAPSYTDNLVNNAGNNDNVYGYGDVRDRTKQRLYRSAVHYLEEKRFAEAAAQFDMILNAPDRIASPSLSKIAYYFAGVSHYLAGNDVAALPLLKRAVKSSGVRKQQREFARQLISDITAD